MVITPEIAAVADEFSISKYSSPFERNAAVLAEIVRMRHMADKLLAHCPDAECSICGTIVCKWGDPLHFHHDGCPSCSVTN